MSTLQFLAWLAVHIVIPIFAPIALLPLLAISRSFRTSAQGAVYHAVKNGQLLWIGIAMSAGACYEIGLYLDHAVAAGRVYAWLGLAAGILIMIFSAVLVMLGAVDGLDNEFDERSAEPTRMMVTSIALTTLSAMLFGFAHYFIEFS